MSSGAAKSEPYAPAQQATLAQATLTRLHARETNDRLTRRTSTREECNSHVHNFDQHWVSRELLPVPVPERLEEAPKLYVQVK